MQAENVSLHDKVPASREEILERAGFPVLPIGNQGPVSSTGTFASAVKTTTYATGNGARPKFLARPKPPARHQRGFQRRPSNSEKQTPRPPATMGTAKQCVLKVAAKSSAQTGLFVSRLAPDTTAP
ncbi:unnamed protein product, partial [Ixodes hexagonus]